MPAPGARSPRSPSPLRRPPARTKRRKTGHPVTRAPRPQAAPLPSLRARRRNWGHPRFSYFGATVTEGSENADVGVGVERGLPVHRSSRHLTLSAHCIREASPAHNRVRRGLTKGHDGKAHLASSPPSVRRSASPRAPTALQRSAPPCRTWERAGAYGSRSAPASSCRAYGRARCATPGAGPSA